VSFCSNYCLALRLIVWINKEEKKAAETAGGTAGGKSRQGTQQGSLAFAIHISFLHSLSNSLLALAGFSFALMSSIVTIRSASLARILVELPLNMKHRMMSSALASQKNMSVGNFGVAAEILETYLKVCALSGCVVYSSV
jgi:hypothetical protein